MNKSLAAEVLEELEWADHQYDPAHDHSFACLICGGAKTSRDRLYTEQIIGHRDGCKMKKALKELS